MPERRPGALRRRSQLVAGSAGRETAAPEPRTARRLLQAGGERSVRRLSHAVAGSARRRGPGDVRRTPAALPLRATPVEGAPNGPRASAAPSRGGGPARRRGREAPPPPVTLVERIGVAVAPRRQYVEHGLSRAHRPLPGGDAAAHAARRLPAGPAGHRRLPGAPPVRAPFDRRTGRILGRMASRHRGRTATVPGCPRLGRHASPAGPVAGGRRRRSRGDHTTRRWRASRRRRPGHLCGRTARRPVGDPPHVAGVRGGAGRGSLPGHQQRAPHADGRRDRQAVGGGAICRGPRP